MPTLLLFFTIKYSFKANIVQVPFGALQAVSCPTKLAISNKQFTDPLEGFQLLTFTTMARSSLAHVLKFNIISAFSHSSIHWTAGCQLAPINFLFIVGFNQFQFVTELAEGILVDITCALLMMEATTFETSLMLVCCDISKFIVCLLTGRTIILSLNSK